MVELTTGYKAPASASAGASGVLIGQKMIEFTTGYKAPASASAGASVPAAADAASALAGLGPNPTAPLPPQCAAFVRRMRGANSHSVILFFLLLVLWLMA